MGSHNDYMSLKKQKLAQQNEEQNYLLDQGIMSKILLGVSVYITGFTEPPSAVLKEMILRNGGVVQMFFSKTHVTHIVATNLPDFKVKLWQNDLVVVPQWIVDCVAAKSRLPEAKYVLYRTSENIKDILSKKATSKSLEVLGEFSDGKHIPETTSSNFVNEFYSNSRLHHLSTSVSELRHYVKSLQSKFHPFYIPVNKSQTNCLVLHIDIDCFFVSISLKSRPELRGKSVCVTHAKPNENVDSYAEISSCSYEAREFGVRNGMFLGKAVKLCPEIVTVPYEFEKYHEASNDMYRILVQKTPLVEVVSCDEAFLDISELVDTSDEGTVELFVQELRQEIYTCIGCTVSAGVGPNKLVARMATRAGKPNGQFICYGEKAVSEYIQSQSVGDLPGIGRSTAEKLISKGYLKCQDLLQRSKTDLSELLGGKTGETVFNFCRGRDDREFTVKHERKSISVEINYGVRVQNINEFDVFLLNLCVELEKRMTKEKVKGSQVSLKLKLRSEDAALEPLKYMGHGICDNVSKSVNIANATNSGSVLHSKVMDLVNSITLVPSDIRGVGIQVSKLKEISTIYSSSCLQKDHKSNEFPVLKVFHCSVPELLGIRSESGVKDLMIEWCKSEEPYQSDVDKVNTYIADLIKYGNISFVEEILRLLRKHLNVRQDPEWSAAFNECLQNTQRQIHTLFQGILEIDEL